MAKDYEKIAYKNYDIKLIAGFMLILCGYVFFFMTPSIFKEKPERQHTNINETVQYGNGKITLSEWNYAPDQCRFRVCITLSDNIADKNVEYKLSAFANFNTVTKKIKACPAEIIYSERDYLVIHIYDVPNDFYCASLTIEDEMDEEYSTTVPLDTDATSPTDSENVRKATVYNCSDTTKCIGMVNEMPEEYYKITRIRYKVSANEKSITDIEDEISQLEDDNSKTREKISELSEELIYQTSNEQIETKKEVESLQRNLESNNNLILQNENEIDKLTEEIKEYEIIIRRIAGDEIDEDEISESMKENSNE